VVTELTEKNKGKSLTQDEKAKYVIEYTPYIAGKAIYENVLPPEIRDISYNAYYSFIVRLKGKHPFLGNKTQPDFEITQYKDGKEVKIKPVYVAERVSYVPEIKKQEKVSREWCRYYYLHFSEIARWYYLNSSFLVMTSKRGKEVIFPLEKFDEKIKKIPFFDKSLESKLRGVLSKLQLNYWSELFKKEFKTHKGNINPERNF